MTEMATPIDKPYGQTEQARADAIARIQREPEADLILQMLGLVDDPHATSRRMAKAQAEMAGHSRPPSTPKGYLCAVCGNALPSHGVCRKSKRCRVVAGEFEEQRWERLKGAGVR